MIPHRFPFRLVDRGEGTHVVVSLTLGAALWRGAGPYPLSLAVEIIAQASLLLLPPPAADVAAPATDGAAPIGLLAGVENAEMRAGLRPGDRLEVRTEVLRRFGPLTMVRGVLDRVGPEAATVASATLLLAQNPAGGEG